MERRKLWIFGDSFTGTGNGQWTVKCCEKFKGDRYYVSSDGSRNTQTIIDIFLRKLQLIEPHDLVILILPTSNRVRLPLETPRIDVEHTNEYLNQDDRSKHLDYFIGTHQYEKDRPEKKLEYPLTDLDELTLENSNSELNINLEKIVNSSKASIRNYSEIIKSLQTFVYFEMMVMSWTDEYEYPIISKNELTTEIGYWESLHDLWKKTKGVEGKKDDFHWSPNMHQSVSEYIIKKYPKYFNT